jgi:hypothetical protein
MKGSMPEMLYFVLQEHGRNNIQENTWVPLPVFYIYLMNMA